jgi:flagellar basal body rod protein FlgG
MANDGIPVSARGAAAQSARLDLAAQNLANVATPGYRGERTGFRARFLTALGRLGSPEPDRSRFDETPGPLEDTRRPLDLALRSRGFFAVRDLAAGGLFYTRNGGFTLDSQGRLVTADGRCEVLDADGAGLVLEPGRMDTIRVAPDGTLSQNGEAIGQLGVVDFQGPGALERHGRTLYAAAGGATPSVSAEARVDQGVLEGSSVDPLSSTMEMMRALRALESNLQMVRFQDAVLERTVNEYGRLPR